MNVQIDLFETCLDGLAYTEEMVTADEETTLVRLIPDLPLEAFRFQGWLGKRRVVSFGWRYDFDAAIFGPGPAIPEAFLPVRECVASLAGLVPEAFEQLLVTEYAPGAGIGWHRDRPVFGTVAGVSLLSPCTLRFRRRAGGGFERAALPVEPRSAYVLSGAARQDWEHSIAPLLELRYALTFRTLSAKGERAKHEQSALKSHSS